MASESSPLLTSSSSRPSRTGCRTSTAHQQIFTRPFPSAVTYDLSTADQATIELPPGSTWTSGPHWHDTHTEFLQVLRGRADIVLGLPRRQSQQKQQQQQQSLQRRKNPSSAENTGSVRAGQDQGQDQDQDADESHPVDGTPHANAGSDGENGDDDDDDDYHHLASVGPLDGVIIVPRGTVHEWRRSAVDGLDDELVVKEWTDPKDGQKETFFRNLNGIILDALREQGELDAEVERRPQGGKAKMSWRMRTLDLELNNLFWRMDNWPLVLEGRWWPGWIHGLATRCVLLGSVVLGKVLGCKGVYDEYETRR